MGEGREGVRRGQNKRLKSHVVEVERKGGEGESHMVTMWYLMKSSKNPAWVNAQSIT